MRTLISTSRKMWLEGLPKIGTRSVCERDDCSKKIHGSDFR